MSKKALGHERMNKKVLREVQTSSNGALVRPASQFLLTAAVPTALGFLAEPFVAGFGGISAH